MEGMHMLCSGYPRPIPVAARCTSHVHLTLHTLHHTYHTSLHLTHGEVREVEDDGALGQVQHCRAVDSVMVRAVTGTLQCIRQDVDITESPHAGARLLHPATAVTGHGVSSMPAGHPTCNAIPSSPAQASDDEDTEAQLMEQ
jgi:hypothetical protein